MIRILALILVAGGALVSCSSSSYNGPYLPVTKVEKCEFKTDRLDVYPDDVRKDPEAYAGVPVVWAGIVRSTDAVELDYNDKLLAKTVFEQHYFDWVQDAKGCHVKLAVSPRGEGLFRATWYMNKTEWCDTEATYPRAEKFAGKGKLALFYGEPIGVDDNGTVVMKYRYLRILNHRNFTTNEFDYGRLGEQDFRVLHPTTTTTTNTATLSAKAK